MSESNFERFIISGGVCLYTITSNIHESYHSIKRFSTFFAIFSDNMYIVPIKKPLPLRKRFFVGMTADYKAKPLPALNLATFLALMVIFL